MREETEHVRWSICVCVCERVSDPVRDKEMEEREKKK